MIIVRALVLCVIGLLLAAPTADAQFNSSILRAQSRVVDRAISRNVERLFKPKLVISQGATGPVSALALSDDERFLVTAVGNRSVRIWDLVVGREVARLPGHTGRVTGIAIAHDGSRAATVGDDRAVRLWDLKRIGEVRLLQGHGAPLTGVAFSRRGDRLVTSSSDGRVILWDVATGAAIATLDGGGAVNALAIAADDTRLFAAGADGGVIVWDLATRARLATLPMDGAATSVAVGRQGRIVAAGGRDGSIRLWDMATGAERGVLNGHGGAVTGISLDEARNTLISGGADATVRRWDLDGTDDGRVLGKHDGAVSFVALGKDGAFALSGAEDGFTNLWNLSDATRMISLISTETGWAVVDGKGRYDGNEQALAGIDWRAEDAAVPIDGFAANYFEPALLPRAMAGAEGLRDVKAIGEGVLYPASVRIQSAKSGGTSASVDVTAEDDKGGGIADVRLYHNGKIVPRAASVDRDDGKNGVARLTKHYDIGLEPGENVLSATAINGEALESPANSTSLSADGAVVAGRLHLLTVGINAYKNPALSLDYARPDANAIKSFFASGPSALPPTTVKELVDSGATKDGILAAIRQLREAPPRDVVVIYMAGHGVSVGDDWYYIPYEVDKPDKPEQLKGHGLSSSELKAEIEALQAKRTFLLLDTCHSGTAVSPLKDYSGLKALRLLAGDVGTHVLAATDRDQYAVELEKLGHGIFTYVLLDALNGNGRGRGETIMARDIIRHVEEQVPILSRNFADYGQYPTGYSRGIDFALALRKRGL